MNQKTYSFVLIEGGFELYRDGVVFVRQPFEPVSGCPPYEPEAAQAAALAMIAEQEAADAATAEQIEG